MGFAMHLMEIVLILEETSPDACFNLVSRALAGNLESKGLLLTLHVRQNIWLSH